jgi:hypothetical protein
MVKTVEKGRALVDPWNKATVFTHIKTKEVGTGKRPAVKRTQRTQFLPFIWK